MNKDEIRNRLTDIFKDVFDEEIPEITDETTAADIEDWDSLSHITLIGEIEDAFGMKFHMNEVLGMKNVGEVIDIIKERINC